ncbi:MAG: RNA polymerase sigma factor [Acidobacteriota bacterium]|nr:RNA polymerase sigma factor [Acidobacteriota bacterium]
MTLSPSGIPAAMDEMDLVNRLRRGDRVAGDTLALAYRGVLFRLALQLLGDREEALDVTQEALLRFFGNIGRFDPQRPARPFLYQIVRNLCTDRFRRKAHRPGESLEDRAARDLPEPVSHEEAPDEALARAELRRQVWHAVCHLKPEHREILVLRDYHDLAYAEIAQVIGIPSGTVMSRLHAARKALRKALVGEELP